MAKLRHRDYCQQTALQASAAQRPLVPVQVFGRRTESHVACGQLQSESPLGKALSKAHCPAWFCGNAWMQAVGGRFPSRRGLLMSTQASSDGVGMPYSELCAVLAPRAAVPWQRLSTGDGCGMTSWGREVRCLGSTPPGRQTNDWYE